jgi:hypothetical protein
LDAPQVAAVGVPLPVVAADHLADAADPADLADPLVALEDLPLEELLGMRGPLMPLVENALTVLACNATFLFLGMCLPFNVGRLCTALAKGVIHAFAVEAASLFQLLPPVVLRVISLYANSNMNTGFESLTKLQHDSFDSLHGEGEYGEGLGFGVCDADAAMMRTCPRPQLLDFVVDASETLREGNARNAEEGGHSAGLMILLGYMVVFYLLALALFVRFLLQCTMDGGPWKVAKAFWRNAHPAVDLAVGLARRGLTCTKVCTFVPTLCQ